MSIFSVNALYAPRRALRVLASFQEIALGTFVCYFTSNHPILMIFFFKRTAKWSLSWLVMFRNTYLLPKCTFCAVFCAARLIIISSRSKMVKWRHWGCLPVATLLSQKYGYALTKLKKPQWLSVTHWGGVKGQIKVKVTKNSFFLFHNIKPMLLK